MQELIIKKSKFYGFAKNINTKDEFNFFLAELQKEYKKASHFCYAYTLNNPLIEKFSDNGEPSGTAGKPILNVIKQNNKSNYAIIVVRYFGGVKLGAGGLLRAYNKIASMVIKNED